MAIANSINSSPEEFTESSGEFLLHERVRKFIPANIGGGVYNLGITVSGGVITIKGADGNDLSATNPAYVSILDNAGQKQLLIPVTSNWSFEDANGSSDIINNTFGWTSGVATQHHPMYIYLTLNDAETAVMPMLSRKPNKSLSPADTAIGAPDDAVADTEYRMWSFENITETDWDENRTICIGSLISYKNTSDDWIFDEVDEYTGIGNFSERRLNTLAAGHNGAAANTYFLATAGTEPQFSSNTYYYSLTRDGYMWIHAQFSNCNTAGVGANGLALALPMNSFANARVWGLNAKLMDNSDGQKRYHLIPYGADTPSYVYLYKNGSATYLTLADIAASDRLEVRGVIRIG